MTDNNVGESRPDANLNLDLEKGSSLKPLPKELITKFLKNSCKEIASTAGCEYNYMILADNVNNITIFTNSEKTGLKIGEELNRRIAYNMAEFIETETGESATRYFRTVTLFESTVEDNRISIQW